MGSTNLETVSVASTQKEVLEEFRSARSPARLRFLGKILAYDSKTGAEYAQGPFLETARELWKERNEALLGEMSQDQKDFDEEGVNPNYEMQSIEYRKTGTLILKPKKLS